MDKWEYEIFYTAVQYANDLEIDETALSGLNVRGKLGWELVTVLENGKCILKRKIEE